MLRRGYYNAERSNVEKQSLYIRKAENIAASKAYELKR
jgi:hypothetical protein